MLKAEIETIQLVETGTVLLADIKFSLEENQVTTILGKNGSGKTTLLNSLTNLLNPQIYSITGSVEFYYKDLLKLSENNINKIRSKNIKYVFQDAKNCFDPLYKLKYYFDNISVSEELLVNLLSMFSLPRLEKIKNYYPFELSGGMAQRIAIVLAAASNPDVIFFDEPTSSLDYGSANILKEFIKNFSAQTSKAVLVVSQDIDFALSISNKLIFLGDAGIREFNLPKAEIKQELLELFDNNK